MDVSLNGKGALVTGASKGIGRAIAQRLVEEGAKVALCARSSEPLEDAVQELQAAGEAWDLPRFTRQPLVQARRKGGPANRHLP